MYGKGAHVDPVACVEDISAELAARTVAGYPHSIWQIVEHMNYWMGFELRKIAGEDPHYPDKAIESWPAHPSASGDSRAAEAQWQATHPAFCGFAGAACPAGGFRCGGAGAKFRTWMPQIPRKSTVHAMLWQITAHNSYHAGQIALLRRQAGAWPPERGGDTW